MTFQDLPDLAVRSLGGAVVSATDESFAGRENLLTPGPAVFDPASFGPKGKVYDGWETRRRRDVGSDAAVVRLGVPGVVRGVVVDTAWFRGNYPPRASVEAACLPGYPTADELAAADWEPLVPCSDLAGDAHNAFAVADDRRWTHLRLSIYPDGGVARLRVHGEAVPDPRWLDVGGVDLAAVELGGRVVGCSDAFYGSPGKLLLPGPARSMGEGWETARRRGGGNDWVAVRLGVPGTIALAELDTTWFIGNAPGEASLRGRDAATGEEVELLARRPLTPDTRHRFLLPPGPAVDEVRLDAFPDGGMARLRLFGTPSPAGRRAAGLRWFNALSAASAAAALVEAGLAESEAADLAARRPVRATDDLPTAVRRLLAGPGAP